MTKRNYTICEDDLWFLANSEVLEDKEGLGAIYSKYSDEQLKSLRNIFQIVMNDHELELEYSGILECALENYESDHRVTN